MGRGGRGSVRGRKSTLPGTGPPVIGLSNVCSSNQILRPDPHDRSQGAGGGGQDQGQGQGAGVRLRRDCITLFGPKLVVQWTVTPELLIRIAGAYSRLLLLGEVGDEYGAHAEQNHGAPPLPGVVALQHSLVTIAHRHTGTCTGARTHASCTDTQTYRHTHTHTRTNTQHQTTHED